MLESYYVLCSGLSIGIFIILAGLYQCYMEFQFIKKGEIVKGVVEALIPVESVDSDGR